jgi:mRNA interferase MazF
MVIQRGEIWWANLGIPAGSSPGYRRPVLVLQSNDFNRSRIATVIVAVITSNMRLAQAPGNVLLPKKASRLPHESVVNVSQVITLDKQFMTERVGAISLRYMKHVDEGLRLVLSL